MDEFRNRSLTTPIHLAMPRTSGRENHRVPAQALMLDYVDNVQSFSHIFLKLAHLSSPRPEIRLSWEVFAQPRPEMFTLVSDN